MIDTNVAIGHQSDVLLDPPAVNDILIWSGVEWVRSRATRAVGDYVSGMTYNAGDELYDGRNLSECLKDGVTSSPFVTPVGIAETVYTGSSLVTGEQLASQIIYGNRYTFPIAAYITGYRIYATDGNSYQVYYVVNPGDNQRVVQILSFIANTTGWIEIVTNQIGVPEGTVLDLVVEVTERPDSPVEVVASYNYSTPQNANVPTAGQIQHGRGSPDVMQINHTSDGGAADDMAATITGLSIGDVISTPVSLERWTVQGNTNNTTWSAINVTPAQTGSAGTKDFTFSTTVETPLDVPAENDYWSGSAYPQVVGLIAVDQPYEDVVTNDNAYGVDLYIQEAYIPDPTEWALKIIGI